MEAFEFKGLWWLPDSPDRKVYGTLSFDGDHHANLSLISSQPDEPLLDTNLTPIGPSKKALVFNKPISNTDIILGISDSGDHVTLHDCTPTGPKLTISRAFIQQGAFFIRNIFIGHHFEKSEDIVFESLTVSLSCFSQWLGTLGFHIQMIEYEDNPNSKEFRINYPEGKYEYLVNELEIAFGSDLKTASSVKNQAVAQIYRTDVIKLKPNQPIHFEQYLERSLYHLRNFFGLATGKAITPLFIRGSLPYTDKPKRSIQVYSLFGSDSDTSQPVSRDRMLFSFEDVEDVLQETLITWFDKSQQYKHVFDLFFGLLYIPPMYTNLEFLVLAQALETYHRDFHGGQYLTEEHYQPIYDAMYGSLPDDIDTDLKNRLKYFLKYGYEFSLRTRIKDLLNNILRDYMEQLNTLLGDFTVFAHTVTQTRNYYTHYSDIEGAVTDSDSLYALVQRLKVLLQICFLHELGLHKEKIQELIKSYQEYIWFSAKD